MIELLKEAILYYGARHQEDMCLEEMNELAVAVLHKRRGREHNIAEEIADVEITVNYLKLTNCCANDVERIKQEKLKRLAEDIGYDKL